MRRIAIVSADRVKAARRYSIIASLFPIDFLDVKGLETAPPSAETTLVVDFLGLTEDDLRSLKSALASGCGLSICVLDQRNRKQVFQAHEFGCQKLVDRRESLSALLATLRSVAGDYYEPNLSREFPNDIRSAVGSACRTLATVSLSAILGRDLPISKLTDAAKNITETITKEGVRSWLEAAQSHHSHSYRHTLLVTGHAVSFAIDLGLSKEQQMLVALSALVHDLGKVKIPLSILDKPGRPTEKEDAFIRRHPEFTREILKTNTHVPKSVADVAVWHHEMMDGTGYPDGLKGDQIPFLVRMLTLADIYSTLTENRGTKSAMSPRQAIQEMAKMPGKLDSNLFKVFKKSVLDTGYGRIRRKKIEKIAM
ncbi:HD-GYP domain-containing protein [Roseibium sp.]|uniref:HD-GYP domain-containing protein n=1 Tax=Roseibium sp. TaxID=1936156 RepID=UPI003B500EAF